MEFRILGSLEALDHRGPVGLGGIKPRAVLAYLLLHSEEPVSSDRLAVALWGEDAPANAVKTVQVHVSRLRRALGEPGVLTTTRAGYRILLGPDDLDAHRFARLVAQGRAALADGGHDRARALLCEALGLWRGPALADLTFEPFAQTEIARLEEQRLDALEIRLEADLAAGRHDAVVGELVKLVGANPVRERLTGQLMLALYRCGRQAEALDAYARTRAHEVRELGIEPGPALKALQARILEQSPLLDRPDETVAQPATELVSVRNPDHRRARTAQPRAQARRPMFGRRSELDALRARLDDAFRGRGSLVLLLGDAGIGKSRLAEAVVEDASGRGADVLWGGAWEAGGAAAYWPWTQVIRQILEARSREETITDLGEGGPYVAQIAPEVGRLLGTASDPMPSLEAEAMRFTAFDAVGSFLRAAAVRRPVVVVIDDLHAADVASVRLLEFVARGLHGARILAIGTRRTDSGPVDPELTRGLADLSRAAHCFTLGGLARQDVVELAASHTAQPLPDGLGDRVHLLTEGNPLFVDEVMRLLGAQGALARPDALASRRLPVPAAVREAIGCRLEGLEAAVVDALEVAAVIGSEFRLDTLAPVLGEELPTLLSQLDSAAEAGLVQELSGTLGTYRFAHALMREALYDGLSAHRRAIAHGRVGETMVEIHGSGRGAPLSELAHHFLEAAPAGDGPRAVHYATRAGKRALEMMAYEQAIDLFGDALRALALGPEQPATRGAILLARGQAEMRAGRLDASRATLLRAAEDARRLDDARLLAEAALASAPWGLATALADEEGLIPFLQEALDRLPEADSELRAKLLARMAAARYWSSTAAYRASLAGEAIAMARRLGDPTTLALVLSDAHRATWDPDSPDRSLPWASEIYAVAERLGNMELAMIAHSWRISLLLELGELAIVDREIETFDRTAARLNQQRALAQGLLHRCARSIIVGRFAEAEGLIGEAAAYAALLQQDPFLSMRLGALAFVLREVQGRLEELEPAVRHFADTEPAMPVWRCALLCVYVQAGRTADLRRAYDALAAEGFDTLPRDNLWLPAIALATEACVHLRDEASAPVLRAMLAPYSGRNVVTPQVAYLGPVDRYLALLAATEGDDAGAAAWLASARELAGRMGARPTCVRLVLDEASWLVERDPLRAAALAADAESEAETLGLEHLVARARALSGQRPLPA